MAGRKGPLSFAIVGSRGVPANYGGFETFAQELGGRLVARGHSVLVTCRRISYPNDSAGSYRGIQRRFVWAPANKYLETPVSSTIALSKVMLFDHPDVVILVNGINAFASWIPRLRGIPVAICVDGIERQRAKWGTAGRLAYLVNEFLSCHVPSVIVSDADVIAKYYQQRYKTTSTVIRYGGSQSIGGDAAMVQEFGLRPGQFVLYVSRLEPENNADLVIDAFREVEAEHSLVIVGDAPYANDFKLRIQAKAAEDSRVKLVGAIYGEGYRALQAGASVYVQATSVGGTHPALVEAMAAGNAICAFDTPENREVLGTCGLFFRDAVELAHQITYFLKNESSRREYERRASERAANRYDWERVTDQYIGLAREMLGLPLTASS
jgi:glycosyltransferase involved in cell wall biosynthesis